MHLRARFRLRGGARNNTCVHQRIAAPLRGLVARASIFVIASCFNHEAKRFTWVQFSEPSAVLISGQRACKRCVCGPIFGYRKRFPFWVPKSVPIRAAFVLKYKLPQVQICGPVLRTRFGSSFDGTPLPPNSSLRAPCYPLRRVHAACAAFCVSQIQGSRGNAKPLE